MIPVRLLGLTTTPLGMQFMVMTPDLTSGGRLYTLKNGVEQRLKQVVPEVTSVEAV